MTRRISKSGNAYTEGSHSTLAGWEPRTCSICENRALVSKENLRFHHDDVTGESLTWHVECELEHGWPLKAAA